MVYREDKLVSVKIDSCVVNSDLEICKKAAIDAGIQLISAVPFLGNVVSAVKTYADSRSSEFRFRQLEEWLLELLRRVEGLKNQRTLDLDWLKTDEGIRVFLGLGEAACDILREEKIKILAGAGVAAIVSEDTEPGNRKRFARIIIDAEIVTLQILRALAEKYTVGDDLWKFPVYYEIIDIRAAVNKLFGGDAIINLTPQNLLDALNDMNKFRMASVYWEPVIGKGLVGQMTIEPRDDWWQFRRYLMDTLDDV